MKEWPLNSVTLSTATHSKLRKALDGTDTQVKTCIINRWMAKMNGGEGYITTEILQRRGTKEKGEKKERKTIVVLRTLEGSRRETPKNQEGELILGPSPRIDFHPFSTHSTIPLPYDLVRLLKNPSLRPSSWAHFSTKFIVLGLLGLGLFTSTVKDLPKVDPTI